jgi:anthranilate synthase component I
MQIPELPAKPTYVEFATDLDFFSLFGRIENHFETCFLLESMGEQGYDARYSVIGFNPDRMYVAQGRHITVTGNGTSETIETPNAYAYLRSALPQNVLSRSYAGGLVGFLGYDAANYFEESLKLAPHADFPTMQMGFFTDGLLHDKMTGKTTYFYFLKNRISLVEEAVRSERPTAATIVKATGQSKSREQHATMVETAKEEIINGNTFQVQIGFTENYTVTGDWLNIYASLRQINPSPHMFFMKFRSNASTLRLIGASPELLYRQRQGEMESFPLAGTARRGATAAEDQKLVLALLSDPKEIAEHNMLVDLHRNDLGRVARYGSVKVRRIFDVKKFSHVQHISSEVVGLLNHGEDMFTALASSFPAGTLSGAPKIESMKIIDRIEGEPRGPYGGAVGHFGFNGDCTFAIPIRTVFGVNDRAFIRASGGVVYDSTPAGEYQEIQNKLAATKKALAEYI